MNNLLKLIFLLLSIPAFSQVGIGTTNPTTTLDVNGSLRVRDLTTGTVETNNQGDLKALPYTLLCYGLFKDNGDQIKAYNCTVRRLNQSTIRVTFATPVVDTSYIINLTGEMRLLSYNLKTTNFFDIILYRNYDNSVHNFLVYKTN